MLLRRRELVGGRVTSGGRIARPNADQTSRLAALEHTPLWAPGGRSSQFLYTRSKLLIASLTAPRPRFDRRVCHRESGQSGLPRSEPSVLLDSGRPCASVVRCCASVRLAPGTSRRDRALAGCEPGPRPCGRCQPAVLRCARAPRREDHRSASSREPGRRAGESLAQRERLPSAAHRGGAAGPAGSAGRSSRYRSSQAPPSES